MITPPQMNFDNKNAYCGWCGTKFAEQSLYPRKCFRCNKDTYINPLPVTVAMIPVWDQSKREWGMLVQKRAIEPKKGEWALPGGYLALNETWQEGIAREVLEETKLQTDPKCYELYSVDVATNSNLLIFGIYKYRVVHVEELKCFVPNEESDEIMLIKEHTELAFPTHTAALNEWLSTQ